MSIIALKSYAQERDVTVVPIDANIDAIHYTLSPEKRLQFGEFALASLTNGLTGRGEPKITARRTIVPGEPPPRLDSARAQVVLDQLESIWREDGFAMTKDGFKSELAILNDALIMASLRMYPHNITVWGGVPASTDLFRSQRYNPYLQYYQEDLVPSLIELSPDLIGISFSYMDQFFYVVSLVRTLRAAGLTTPVVIGGSGFTTICKAAGSDVEPTIPVDSGYRIIAVSSMLGTLDPLAGGKMSSSEVITVGVQGEGEGPLGEICRRLAQGEPFLDVPSLVYIDPDKRAVIFNDRCAALPGDEIPKMDLAGLGIGKKYLSPIPMAPIIASRGCYWNKCTFCNLPHTLDSRYRVLPIDTVLATAESYVNEFGVELAFFCDEMMGPPRLRDLTDRLAQKDLSLPFFTMLHIEKGHLPVIGSAAKGGLKFVAFGLESACERVAAMMNKGYKLDVAKELLDECVRHGVRVQYFVMFGFPTETPAEADETLEYLASNHDKLWCIRATPWLLTPSSHIHSHPEEFGMVASPGKTITPDDSTSYTMTKGIDYRQAKEYVQQLRRDPDLRRIVLTNGQEDYRAILDMLESSP
ncbi:hypothetical protein LCGC14_0124980 [marine sediment metagenome]|uniref:Radical SAM core domain-containing protein n=1 Tax=marine sediment metagenome TaxID=412755 RepID=A0A0F9Y7U7_9ZZZZ